MNGVRSVLVFGLSCRRGLSGHFARFLSLFSCGFHRVSPFVKFGGDFIDGFPGFVVARADLSCSQELPIGDVAFLVRRVV